MQDSLTNHDPVVSILYDENARARQRPHRPSAESGVKSTQGDHPRRKAQLRERATRYRSENKVFAAWAAGYGLIKHEDTTQVRIFEMARHLAEIGAVADSDAVFRILTAVDRVCSAGMWLVVHQTYAHNVYLDGRPLARDDFKPRPEGHTGGALNMVPAYAGYLAANALTDLTRSWMMGPGHCVSAIDSLNLLVGNLEGKQAERYDLSDGKLSTFVRDFYSYTCAADGSVAVPMGSHVNANTAGGLSEGGYLGFAELQYVHMPLPGERLVAFLSDGAFEEQRGSDWAPRWWRAEDSGLVTPILLANGRRIDQRSAIYQNGGVDWLRAHLSNNSFDPIVIDGRDPADFAWSIIDSEQRLGLWSASIANGDAQYPVPLPYVIAEAPKGFGFPGQATNDAHNLPLGTNPFEDDGARRSFNAGAHALHVPVVELKTAIGTLNNHAHSNRPREKDHALAHRKVATPTFPEPSWSDPAAKGSLAPMVALDVHLTEIIKANPQLRPRIGNPDEMRSNRLNKTLDLLNHRVVHPEPGMAESVHGGVITALNEEAVACAAIGNKGGINLVATYEAFGMKMLGAFRQELIFARHQKELGAAPGWLSVPVVMTSHTWENGKNEQSHQDTGFCESMLAEMNDVSRVLFPPDANSAIETLRATYSSKGQIWTLVVAKNPIANMLTRDQAAVLLRDGAVRLRGTGQGERVVLTAIGGYQCAEVLRASDRLAAKGIAHGVVCMAEPGRFRAEARDSHEAEILASADLRKQLYPAGSEALVFLTHTRPEAIAAIVSQWDRRFACLGYSNRGGTLDVPGMLFANRCTWAHTVAKVAAMLGMQPDSVLDPAELAAVAGKGDPTALLARAARAAR